MMHKAIRVHLIETSLNQKHAHLSTKYHWGRQRSLAFRTVPPVNYASLKIAKAGLFSAQPKMLMLVHTKRIRETTLRRRERDNGIRVGRKQYMLKRAENRWRKSTRCRDNESFGNLLIRSTGFQTVGHITEESPHHGEIKSFALSRLGFCIITSGFVAILVRNRKRTGL